MTDAKTQLLISGGLLAGGLGLSGWQAYKAHKLNKKMRRELNKAIADLPPNLKLSKQQDIDLLRKQLGVSTPVAVVRGKKAKELGVTDNAFFVQPGLMAKALARQSGYKGADASKIDSDGFVVMSDKFGPVPILAHELGHAKDHKDGKLPGMLGNVTLGLLAAAVPMATSMATHKALIDTGLPGWGRGLLAGAVSAVPSYLLGKLIWNRTIGAERRATENALKALRSIRKYRRGRSMERAEKLLDVALGTYKQGEKAAQSPASAVAGVLKGGAFAGLGDLLSGIGTGYSPSHPQLSSLAN